MIVPCLASLYLLKAQFPHHYILLALAFCWLGDLVLMGTYDRTNQVIHESDRQFLSGLSLFLMGHLFYGLYFSTLIQININHIFNQAALGLFLLYGTLIIKEVKARGTMLIGTILYSLAIGAMMLLSINLFVFHRSMNHFILGLGALLFGSYDTVLAFRDIKKLKMPNTYVMFSYIAGQYLIILSLVQ